MRQVLPITPEEASHEQLNRIPDFVIEIVNNLIVEDFSLCTKSAVVRQKDIIAELRKLGYTDDTVFSKRWLDIETIYKEAGWNVEYDSPAYNETYSPVFKFSKKK